MNKYDGYLCRIDSIYSVYISTCRYRYNDCCYQDTLMPDKINEVTPEVLTMLGNKYFGAMPYLVNNYTGEVIHAPWYRTGKMDDPKPKSFRQKVVDFIKS